MQRTNNLLDYSQTSFFVSHFLRSTIKEKYEDGLSNVLIVDATGWHDVTSKARIILFRTQFKKNNCCFVFMFYFLRSCYSMPPTNFSWFVKDRLAALGLPSTRADIEFLCSNGVKQLISLTERRPSLHGFQLTHVHIPVVDMTPPSIEQVNEFISVVELAYLKGEVSV